MEKRLQLHGCVNRGESAERFNRTEWRGGDGFACLDSCSDGRRGREAQALLAKVDHGLVAPLFGLHNVLVDLLSAQHTHTRISATPR